MKRLKISSVLPDNTSEDWYDINTDWPLIEASFLAQYGIRLRTVNDMPYTEFCSYLSGIMPDTPLGNIVQIRSETNKDALKNFTKEQRRIRSEWVNRNTKKMDTDSKEYNDIMEEFKNMFKSLGGDAKV